MRTLSKLLWINFCMVYLVSFAYAGEVSTSNNDSLVINPGRPTFTMSPLAVPKGTFVFEMGYTLQQIEGVTQNVIGEVLLRYGLTDNIEFRLIGNSYIIEFLTTAESTQGFQDPALGLKYTLRRSSYQGFNLLDPSIGIHFFSSIPAGNQVYTSGRFQPGIMLTGEFPLGANTTLTIEGAYLQQFMNEEITTEQDFAINIVYNFSPTISTFVEYFTLIPNAPGNRQQFLQSGVVFTLYRIATIDFRAGTGLYQSAGDFLFGIGGAIMF